MSWITQFWLSSFVILSWPAISLCNAEEERLSDRFTLTVNGTSIPVYTAEVDKSALGGPYSFAGFELLGQTTVVITSTRSLERLQIRPAAYGISAKIAGNQATIQFDKPLNCSFEVDGLIQPLHLFVEPPEVDRPLADSPNVLWFGPGIHRPDGGVIRLRSGQTLYLERGAIVKAGVSAEGARNIKICGRGILDGSDWAHWGGPHHFFNEFKNCTDVHLEGITLRGAYHWNIVCIGVDGMVADGVKIVAGRVQNDDGFDLCNSSRIKIRNCFVRTDDDCIAIKGKHDPARRPVKDITIENCVFWCDRARVVLIGHESQTPVMGDIVATDCHVLSTGLAPILLEPGENCVIENVRFERWTIDLRYGLDDDLIRLRPLVNEYMQDKVPGHIRRVLFKDIAMSTIEGFRPLIRLRGGDETHVVSKVSFTNMSIDGEPFPARRYKIGRYTDAIAVPGKANK